MNNSRKFPKSNKNMIIINPYIRITLSFLWHTLTVVDKDRQENYKSALVRKTIILYIEYILFVYSLFLCRYLKLKKGEQVRFVYKPTGDFGNFFYQSVMDTIIIET